LKLAVIDLDGVVANVDARFARAEEVKLALLSDRSIQLGERERTATNRYWQEVFNPEYVPLDTLIDGTGRALDDVEEEGYDIVFLTSRPEAMRQATLAWLDEHGAWENIAIAEKRQLVMKAPAFQYVKTTVWKAGMVQTLSALYGASRVLVVDDEQANLNEIIKYATVQPVVPGLMIARSLSEAVAKLNGTWVEPDPFLPEFPSD